MRRWTGVSIAVVLLCLLSIVPVSAQGRVIPFTVIEIECSEVAGEEVEEDGVIHSRDQKDTIVWFSTEPVLNGQGRNVLSWDYYMEPDVGLYGGETVFTPTGVAGTFLNSFSGYWDAEGGSFSARGFGTGELAGMEIIVSGGSGTDLESALEMAKGDPRIVDGNPCHPGPMPTHGEASFLFGQLIDNRPPGITTTKIVRRYIEAWEQADVEALTEMIAEDFVNHSPPLPPDREGMLEFAVEHRSQFPTGEYTLQHVFAEGNLVFVYGHYQGTHDGEPFMGIPASGAEASFDFSLVLRLEDGKIAERWATADDIMGMLVPLGFELVPPGE